MTDTDILRKALERYRNATANNTAFKDDVIVFLEKEIDSYREKIERMEQLEDNVQILTTFAEDRTSDGGTMTLATHTDTKTVQEVLLQNGYFVTSHIDDEPNKQDDETITIEFWRA